MIVRSMSKWIPVCAASAWLVVLTGVTPTARPQAGAQPAASAAIPVDPAIAIATLPNGLKYYVRANGKPERRAELRLVVKAGSVLEDDDQQGLAHMVEHMAFNGTKNFPKNDIIAFIEALGMRFGADLNASTGFDETKYILTVPTDKPGVMDRAMQILEDWAHNVTFDPAEIDKERGVVIEEWRGNRGAGARLTDRMFPLLLAGSRYADRIPIGKTEILQNFKPARLTQFYSDWYRPDLMAVVAVGDFNRAEVEALVRKHFTAIPAKPSPKPRPVFDMPNRPGTTYAILTDKELPGTGVEVDTLLPNRPDGTVAAYRAQIVDALVASMLNARLQEIALKPNAPFLGASVGRSQFLVRTKDNASLFARVKDGGAEQGLDALYTEVNRVAKFGFTASELERNKLNRQRSMEIMVAEKDSRTSGSRADEYIRNFLFGESLPTTDEEAAMSARLMAGITLDEVNRVPKEWFGENNRIVLLTAPDKPGVAVPTQAQLAAAMKTAAAKAVQPYVDAVASSALLAKAPTPGVVTKSSTNATTGITEWELANGVKVVLKPTTFKQDEVLFDAYSPGGTSLASDADFIPASTAVAVVTAGGVGTFSATDLPKILAGKAAGASPYILELYEGIRGSASVKDLETMFQLIYLRFTQPRADAQAVAAMAARQKAALANQAAVPEIAFFEAMTSTLYGNHPRRQLTTAASVDQWNLDKSMAFYKDRFSDASDFTFFFVGNFQPDTIKPLIEKYLGSLPATHRKETWKDVGVKNPTTAIEKRVEKGVEPKSLTGFAFTGPMVYDQTQRIAIRAMTDTLQMRLQEVIREELGGTYGISVAPNYTKTPRPEYEIDIQFGCDPARTDALVKRVLTEIEGFKANGPSPKSVSDERETLLRTFEGNSTQNAYLLVQLMARYRDGDDFAGLWSVPDYYRKIDAAMIQQAAKTYLNTGTMVRVSLFPQK